LYLNRQGHFITNQKLKAAEEFSEGFAYVQIPNTKEILNPLIRLAISTKAEN
jgi:hypothetical protein